MTAAVELQITDVAFGGKGVAHANGKAVFVPYVIDGETVSASITREHKKFLEAELESIVTASPHRVEPRCPYFGRCGGCVYQHIDYERQLALKWRQVKETLRRIGGLKEPPMRPFIPSPIEYEYRNRITVHVRDGGGGFFPKRLRGRFGKVIGIDWDQHAIAVAREDTNENETYVAADVEAELGARLQSIAPPSDGG